MESGQKMKEVNPRLTSSSGAKSIGFCLYLIQNVSSVFFFPQGLVWSTRPNDVETQIIMRSRQIMQNLEEETGINSGWINNGGLFCATTKERLDEFKRMHTVRIHGILYFACSSVH